MARFHSQYVCQQCGYSQVGWSGKCPNCSAWNTLVETVTQSGSEKGKKGKSSPKVEAIRLDSIRAENIQRMSTKIVELDRVLGGGLVPGQVVLLAGEPGIGKSTLLLQVVEKLGRSVYVSGEESANQIKIRAERLKTKNKDIFVLEENDIDSILASIESLALEEKPKVVVLDSIQTMNTNDLSGMSGSVGQIRECTFRIVRMAKRLNISIVIVGHVTKEGTVAGPSLLAHLVDTVLWFEGDKNLTTRIIRAYKNRFGATDEAGVFEMKEQGLESVANLSSLFLSSDLKNVPGNLVSVVMQGTRPMMVEVQSLVVKSKLVIPRRVAQGFDVKRLDVILAVLGKKCHLPIADCDVFVNIVGGVAIKEPGADLAVALSIVSSYLDKAISFETVGFGEIGLLGEIRAVLAQEKRIKEAKQLGYKNIISSEKFTNLNEAIKSLFKKS